MSSSRPPLWKQLLGAVAGSAAALALFHGYTFTRPHIVAVMEGIDELPLVATLLDRYDEQQLSNRTMNVSRVAQEAAANIHFEDIPQEELPKENDSIEVEWVSLADEPVLDSGVLVAQVSEPLPTLPLTTSAPALPDAGPALWLSLLGAISVPIGMRFRKKYC